MTRREVRDFLNTLSEEELDKPAIIMGEEDGFPGGEIFVERLGEDYFLDEDNTMCPKSCFSEQEFQEQELRLIYTKEEVFFHLKE